MHRSSCELFGCSPSFSFGKFSLLLNFSGNFPLRRSAHPVSVQYLLPIVTLLKDGDDDDEDKDDGVDDDDENDERVEDVVGEGDAKLRKECLTNIWSPLFPRPSIPKEVISQDQNQFYCLINT